MSSYAIKVGWLIDGSGGPIQQNKMILVRNGIIEDIVSLPAKKAGFAVMDQLMDCTVLPGLIDCHVHLCLPESPRSEQPTEWPEGIEAAVIYHRQKEYIKNGVVAVRDGGDRNSALPALKASGRLNRDWPLVVQVAETAWHCPGRYGRLIGREVQNKKRLDTAVAATPAHVDHIKIINSGLNSLTHFGRQTAPQFAADMLKAAVVKAGEMGLKTMVHANGKNPVKAAVLAGCDSIEHGFFMGRENLEHMAQNEIYWVPTAGTMQALAKRFDPDSIEADTAKKNLDHQIKQIETARKIGVKIALGTDAGSAGVKHGQSLADEFSLLMAAGFTSAEAVACATANGAALMRLDQLGILMRGKAATFVAFQGPPQNLPQAIKDIKVVYVDGIRINCSDGPQTSGKQPR